MSAIVVGLQATPTHQPALDFAISEAIRRRLPLEVVHAYQIPTYGDMPMALAPGDISELREAAQSLAEVALDRAKDRVPGGRTVDAQLCVLESDPTTALLSRSEHAVLLVVGCRGANAFERGVFGSVSAACLHRAPAPVTVVPDDASVLHDRGWTSRVLVALDGSPASLAALTWATAQAREWGCPLIPVVVSPSHDRMPPDMHEATNDVVAVIERQVAEAGGSDLDVHPRALIGDPIKQILALLTPTDLLVLGSRGHGALASWVIGSTSLSLAEKAPCPVTVVRAGQARREVQPRPRQATGV